MLRCFRWLCGLSSEDQESSDRNRSEELAKFLKQFEMTDERLKNLMSILSEEIKKGLRKRTNADSSVKCFPTYVHKLPTGKERGKFLALDLGGSNFRILLIVLGDGKFESSSETFAIPESLMRGSASNLFEYITECLHDFILNKELKNEQLHLGFTFSFPLVQKGIKRAMLVRWTKGFSCPGGEGKDVVEMLETAINRKNLNIKVEAILNDTTGCLISCASRHETCYVGVIVGTGTNACYMEKLENVELFEGSRENLDEIIINLEWGALGDNGCIDHFRTEFDKIVDKSSVNPGQQFFEKLISGMYLGEIVRLVLLHLQRNKLFLSCKPVPLALQEMYKFKTKYMSRIEVDKGITWANTKDVIEKNFKIKDYTTWDLEVIQKVCQSVTRRSAFLLSAGIATLLNRMGRPKVTVGMDGSLYRFHPTYHDYLKNKIGTLKNPEIQFDLQLSVDASGRGAALIASVMKKAKDK